eukprot:TRINITY_DN4056_c0_g1_i1.p1 TRINITY_DN4056_c0_g1~~TRINITY_DN4056_c0_g1_i1.p1  ORF type:complete len:568 (+),score=104.22 TRINITY_DN4056_c0_g1_i1:64-1704(+)
MLRLCITALASHLLVPAVTTNSVGGLEPECTGVKKECAASAETVLLQGKLLLQQGLATDGDGAVVERMRGDDDDDEEGKVEVEQETPLDIGDIALLEDAGELEDTPLKPKRPKLPKVPKSATPCETQAILKEYMLDNFANVPDRKRAAPQFIRAAFHDAIDENNLLAKDGDKWKHASGDYGGMDGCLYSPLSDGDSGKPSASHNRNLGLALGFANRLSVWALKAGLCATREDCAVDLVAFGAITAIEMAGGPSIGMKWGRKKGDCKKMIVESGDAALKDAPALRGLDDPNQFRDAFQILGFDAAEQTALMGAHTFGKLSVCAGGLNGIEHGPFCDRQDALDPPVTDANLVENGCKPKIGVIANCWTKKDKDSNLTPVFATKKGVDTGFGDGGFWDRTPQTFDNDYFKLFVDEAFEGKDNCCGRVKGKGCDMKGQMVNLTSKKPVAEGPCGVEWCRSDKRGRTHMKSTKTWVETDHDFVRKGYQHGVTKRMIRLPGDWALLARGDTREVVKQFAKDQDAFFSVFKQAFGKVLDKGHAKLQNVCEAAL